MRFHHVEPKLRFAAQTQRWLVQREFPRVDQAGVGPVQVVVVLVLVAEVPELVVPVAEAVVELRH